MQASESDNDCDGEGTGNALHIAFTTGQVYTQIPLFKTYAMGAVEWDFRLKYNTANSRNTPAVRGFRSMVGWGWRHSFQYDAEFDVSDREYTEAGCSMTPVFRFTDSTGRVETFVLPQQGCPTGQSYGQGTTWSTAPSPGRAMSLSGWTEFVGGNWRPVFKLTDRDGQIFLFKALDSTSVHYIDFQLQTITDRRGRITRFVYDFADDLYPSAVISPHGRRVRFFYDGEDPDDTEQYEYCDNESDHNYIPHSLHTIEHPDGKRTVLEQNGDNELISVLDPEQALQSGQPKQTFQYLNWFAPSADDVHYISRETLKNGRIFEADYEPNQITLRAGTSPTAITARVRASLSAVIQFGHAPVLEPGSVTYIDGEGHEWTIERDASTRMISRMAENGEAQTWEFASNGWLSKIIDQNENTTEQGWTTHGGVSTVTDAEGNTTTIGYSSEFPEKRTSRQTPGDRTWTFTYDDSTTAPAGTTGDLLSVTDPENETVTYSYETWTADADVPCYVYPLTLPGRIKKIIVTDRDGRVTWREYDPRGNLTKITRDPAGLNLRTEYAYDNHPTDDNYPGMGRVTKRTVLAADSDTPNVVSEWDYDAMGRVRHIKEGPSGGAQLVTEYKYDAHGLPIEIIDPTSRRVQLTYDIRNRLEYVKVDSTGLDLRTRLEYDGNDRLVKRYDPNHFTNGQSGYVTDYAYDQQGFLRSITDPADADAVRHSTVFWCDPAGNVVGVERDHAWGTSNDQTLNVRNVYDELNRRVQTIVDPTPDTSNDPPLHPGRSGGASLTTTYEYTPTGTCSCSGATAGGGLIRKIIDPNGNITYFHYDDLDRRVKIVRKVGADNGEAPDIDDAVTTLVYDDEGHVTDAHGPEDEHVHYAYDNARRRNSMEAYYDGSNSLDTAMTYTASGLLRSLTTPGGNQIKLTYDDYGRVVSAGDRPAGTSGSGGYTNTLTLQYEANGNLWKRTSALSGQTVEFEYDAANRVIKQFDPLEESPTDLFTEYLYDANGDRTSVIDRLGTETEFTFDQRGRLIKTTENKGGSDSTQNTYTYFRYNSLAQTQIKDHDNNQTNYQYDSAGRLAKAIYPDSDDVDFGYDFAGNLTSRIDQRSITTTYGYNDLDHLTGRSYSSGASETFSFDRSGRLRAADNGAAQLDFVYDLLGRLTQTEQAYVTGTSPLVLSDPYVTILEYVVGPSDSTRVIHYPNSARSVTESFDRRSNMVGVTVPDPLNSTKVNGVTFQYDAANRRTGAKFGNAWTWDSSGGYQPGSMTNLLQSTYDFDLNNRLLEITHAKQVSSLTNLFNVEYGYDIEGNPTYKNDLINPERSELYQYDERYRLTNFRRGTLSGLPSSPAISDPSLIADAELPQVQSWPNLGRRGNWGDSTAAIGHSSTVNGTDRTQRRLHNGVNEAERVEARVASSTKVAVNELVYDAAGNLTRIDVMGDMNCDGQVTVGDIAAFVMAATNPANYAATYPNCSIDLGDVNGDGNVTVGDIGAFTAAVSATGGMQSVGYVYDAENRLVEVNDGLAAANDVFLEIRHDAVGRRVLGVEYENVEDPCGDDDPAYPVATRHVYLGLTPIEEYQQADCPSPMADINWELAREFLWGNRYPEPLALVDWTAAGEEAHGEAEWLYYLRDRLGSVVGLVAPGRQSAAAGGTPAASEPRLVERYVYDPYGATTIETWDQSLNSGVGGFVRVDQSEFGNSFAWTGQRFDGGVGLYHFLFRSYSPKLGRWMQRDPLGYVDSMNLYEAVRGNPTTLLDPLGLEIRVGGTDNQRDRAEELLRKLCDRARVDPKTGRVNLEQEPTTCPATQPDGPPKPPTNAGCPMLQKLIDSKKKTIITFTKTERMRRARSPGGFLPDPNNPFKANIAIQDGQKPSYKDAKGNTVETGTWHVLWDELTHAIRWVENRDNQNTETEEQEQIKETNKLLESLGLPPRVGH